MSESSNFVGSDYVLKRVSRLWAKGRLPLHDIVLNPAERLTVLTLIFLEQLRLGVDMYRRL